MSISPIFHTCLPPCRAPTSGSTPFPITPGEAPPSHLDPPIPAAAPPARPCPTHACSSRPASRRARRSAQCGRAPISLAARGSRRCTPRAARSLARSAARTQAEAWVAGTALAAGHTGRGALRGLGRGLRAWPWKSGHGASQVFSGLSVLGGAI